MNITHAKTPCQQPLRQRNRSGAEMLFKRFLPAVAGTVASVGGGRRRYCRLHRRSVQLP